ncbi:MAG: tRNA preQ1(34) S-adenosylmethionine ribosyltransferase-isomerase QueA [Candidatus Obscuribacterales bacterium]|nr:tRNA preQ1(34) S-adenosylmethionine ribosyltransferase-isomerase QueA [Candidatus Obscuribacterales bacterium]
MPEPSIAPDYSIEDFQYELPPELVAQEPLKERHTSRLMRVNRRTGEVSHHVFADIAEMLVAGDVLVLNDTRVIPARLSARRASGGKVDILLIKPDTGGEGHWQAMATPLRKLRQGERLTIACGDKLFHIDVAGFCETEDGQRRAIFNLGPGRSTFELLAAVGQAPLPPYIHRHDDETEGSYDDASRKSADLTRYQTVFARTPGAVAAPTAGLHFSEELLNDLRKKGIETCFVTLHVGPGTFKPVTTSVLDHTVEAEELTITPETAAIVNRARQEGRRIVAVGTTSCRALESAGKSGILEPVESDRTSLYIRPGYQFKIVDALITNFHLSKSSLLILVSAFAGRERIMNAYQLAVSNRYRFYSYGDAMFIADR